MMMKMTLQFLNDAVLRKLVMRCWHMTVSNEMETLCKWLWSWSVFMYHPSICM